MRYFTNTRASARLVMIHGVPICEMRGVGGLGIIIFNGYSKCDN